MKTSFGNKKVLVELTLLRKLQCRERSKKKKVAALNKLKTEPETTANE